jgi:radical SAM family protein
LLNPVQRLKLQLMTEGLAVTRNAINELSRQGSRPLTLADYATTSGISLLLAEDIWVNAPIQEHNPNFITASPPHLLDFGDAGFSIRSGQEEFPAWPVPVPDYHDQLNPSEERYTSYAITHTDRVRISPIVGCGMVCKFCDLPYKFRYRRKRIDGLIDSIQRALEDKTLPARHVLISGGTPKDEDIDYLKTVYRSVAETFPTYPVDIMMVPLPGLLDPQSLYDQGITGLSINIEIYNREIAHRIMPQKYELGIEYYLDFIARAVAVFGLGKVRSLLIAGLEPPEDTLTAMQKLAERGCDPVLSPFRPDPSTPMRNHPLPSIDLLERLYLEGLEIVSRHSVKLGPRCIPCQHNTLTFPDGSSDYYHS